MSFRKFVSVSIQLITGFFLISPWYICNIPCVGKNVFVWIIHFVNILNVFGCCLWLDNIFKECFKTLKGFYYHLTKPGPKLRLPFSDLSLYVKFLLLDIITCSQFDDERNRIRPWKSTTTHADTPTAPVHDTPFEIRNIAQYALT